MTNQRRPIIGPYEPRPAVCRDYDRRAPEVAAQIARLIHEHRPQIFAEHVGSTSVPGCAGKGIVDLMIPVPEGEMESVKQALDQLGFQHQVSRDPFPEERPMRVGSVVHDGDTFLLHVHCIPADSPEVDDTRFFRACLRADRDLMKAYIAKKRAIIDSGVTDSLEYCYKKGEFIKEVSG